MISFHPHGSLLTWLLLFFLLYKWNSPGLMPLSTPPRVRRVDGDRAETPIWVHLTPKSAHFLIFFQDRARSQKQNSPFLNNKDNIPWAKHFNLCGFRGCAVSGLGFSSGLARQQLSFSILSCTRSNTQTRWKPGKTLSRGRCQTFHLKRKLHLCALPPYSPLRRTGISQLTHLCSFD